MYAWKDKSPSQFLFEEETIVIPNQRDHYLFSFVVAIFNSSEYLTDTIESIIAQDIGFEQHCQLILVDDGSTDKSLEICTDYATKYPCNIVVVKKDNGGVSSARNAGMHFALGEYINFIDSDDQLSTDVCTKVKQFFDQHHSETDTVAINTKLFGIKTGDSWFNKKFESGTRVINLWKSPHIYLNSVNNCFFHKRIKNQLSFDERLSISEDLKVVNTVLLNKYTLGVIQDCYYYYRIKTASEGSLAANAKKKIDWYTPYLKYVCNWFFDLCQKKIGFIPEFLQLTLLRDLYNRFDNNDECTSVLNEEEFIEYKSLLIKTMGRIYDSLYYKCDFITRDYTLYFMALKYGIPQIELKSNDVRYYWNNGSTNVVKKPYLMYERCTVYNNHELKLEGYAIFNNIRIPKELFSIDFELAGNLYPAKIIRDTNLDKLAFGDEYVFYRVYFEVILPVKNTTFEAINVITNYDQLKIPILMNGYGTFFGAKPACDQTYYSQNDVVVKVSNGQVLTMLSNKKEISKLEKNLCSFLRTNKATTQCSSAYYMRKIVSMYKKIKPIWIISDRYLAAGDNGEALFKYLLKKKAINAYYAIDGSSSDYNKLKKKYHHRILDLSSKKYIATFLRADCIISSHFDRAELMPISNKYVQDIVSKKYHVFLQHGITKDDVSKFYSRKLQNIDLFICAAKPEYESIIQNPNYFCDESITKLTGFARFDLLKNDPKKIILFMPTWRNELVNFTSDGAIVSDTFLNSTYYTFYHELLNNEHLQKIVLENGYKLVYFPHQNMLSTDVYFKDIPNIEIVEGTERNYAKYFADANLMITDYSSTAFDFAYLRKPVIYCQADMDSFFENHTYDKGYFDYKENGFGPVTVSIDETISAIESVINRNCKLDELYLQRIVEFFPFSDNKNCERIKNEIDKMMR